MFKRLISSLVCFAFIFSNLQYSYAQDFSIDQLPIPGSMISVTPAYVPLTLKGLIVHPENALKFDFLMDTGYSHLKGNGLSDEALKIMKYFLTALTISEDDLWVNLSPYEKGRTIQRNFGQTMMGRDLLAQDYVLKQLTSSLINPEKALGKEFWQKVYSKATQEFGTTQIPVNTFNKVWIVPSEAVVWEHEGKAFIVKSHLKVMLEEDYLALQKNTLLREDTSSIGARMTRSIVLPVLEKEVNEGKNFAQLRQMFQAMILATWYKKALRKSILNKVYADKEKLAGIGYKNSSDVELIYQQYLKAFRKGAFNLIKEDVDLSTGQTVPRKYFSGGFSLNSQAMVSTGANKGATSFLLALAVWTGPLTSNQQQAVAYATQPAGRIIDATWQADLAPVANRTNSMPPVQAEKEQKRDAAMFSSLHIGDMFLHKGDVNRLKEELRRKKTREIFRFLKDPVEEVRLAAVVVLGESHDKQALDSLLAELNDESFEVCNAAVGALEKLEDQRAIRHLIKTYEEKRQGFTERKIFLFRSEIITALGKIGGKEAIDFLLNLLKNDKEMHITVAEAIAESSDVNGILPLLKDENTRIRRLAKNKLKVLEVPKDKMIRGYILALGADSNDAVDEANNELKVFEPKDLVSAYIAELDNNDPNIKRLAALALGELRDASAESPLMKLLKDPNEEVRAEAVVALSKLNGPDVFDTLLELFQKEKHWLVRTALVVAFKRINDPRAVDDLLTLLRPYKTNVERHLRFMAGNLIESLGKGRQFKVEDAVRIRLATRLDRSEKDLFTFYDQALKYAQEGKGFDFVVIYKSAEWLHPTLTSKILLHPEELTIEKGGPLKQTLDDESQEKAPSQPKDLGINEIKDAESDVPSTKEAISEDGESTIDAAMSHPSTHASPHSSYGGIALNARMLDMQVKHDDSAMSLPVGQQFLDKINFQGFFPRIISIHSINLSSLLGFDSSQTVILAKA